MTPGRETTPSPEDGEGANAEGWLPGQLAAPAAQDILTRPSFSTARRERPSDLSHLRQTLNPGMPVLPFPSASLDADWAVACVSRGRLAYRGS